MSIRELVRSEKSAAKKSLKLKDETLKFIEGSRPINCAFLLELFSRLYKFVNDFDELEDEIKEITPNLHFRINSDSNKYKKEFKNTYNKEEPESMSNGIVFCDIYYTRKDLRAKAGFKALAKLKEGVDKLNANILADQSWFEHIIIRVAAHPPGKINVNDIITHVDYYDALKKDELTKLIKKTSFSWTIFAYPQMSAKSKPKKIINKFKSYKDMITHLTKYIVKDITIEGGKIKKYFTAISSFLGSKEKIHFSDKIIFKDSMGNQDEIEEKL